MKKAFLAINRIDSTTAELLIYGDIFPYDGSIKASDVVSKLRELEQSYTVINIRINSNGGDVYEGITIFNAIRRCSVNCDTYIDGIAASMGSVIAMAGKRVFMSKYARLMTHKPSGGSFGNAMELRKVANEIDACEKILNEIYMSRTGLTSEQVTEKFLNGADNYFSATAALQAKLIDDIYDGEAVNVPGDITNTKDVWNIYNNRLQAKLGNEISPMAGNEGDVYVIPATGTPYKISRSEFTAAAPKPAPVKAPKELFISWDTLIDTGKLDRIRDSNPTLFAAIYKKEFGKHPQNMTGVNTSILNAYETIGNNGSDASVTEDTASGIFPEELYMTWDELMDKKKLDDLKQQNYTLFAVVYKEEFNCYPKDDQQINSPLALKYQNELQRHKTEELYNEY